MPTDTMKNAVQSLSPEKCKQILSAGLGARERLEQKRAERVTLYELDSHHKMLVSARLNTVN